MDPSRIGRTVAKAGFALLLLGALLGLPEQMGALVVALEGPQSRGAFSTAHANPDWAPSLGVPFALEASGALVALLAAFAAPAGPALREASAKAAALLAAGTLLGYVHAWIDPPHPGLTLLGLACAFAQAGAFMIALSGILRPEAAGRAPGRG